MEFLGILAGFFTTISSVPQIIKILKTKSVEDVSLGMFVLILVGVLLWVLYGISINSFSLIMWNTVVTFLSLVVIVLKIKYSNKQ